MDVTVLTLGYSVSSGGFETGLLEELSSSSEILSVTDHCIEVGGLPRLVLVVRHERRGVAKEPGAGVRSGAFVASGGERGGPLEEGARSARREGDPTLGLSDEQLRFYEAIREWRRERAYRDACPAYTILTNREIVGLVMRRPQSLKALGAIRGIGKGKLKKYGPELIEVIDPSAVPCGIAVPRLAGAA